MVLLIVIQITLFMQTLDLRKFDYGKLLPVNSVSPLINNLNNIKKQLKNQLQGVTLFYRGQADSTWEIKPGIYRDNGEIDNEHRRLSEMTRLCPYEFLQCHSAFERLVKMQHYSLHTRLLDITTNPLIAAFFASNQQPEQDGVIEIFFVKDEEVMPYNDRWANLIS